MYLVSGLRSKMAKVLSPYLTLLLTRTQSLASSTTSLFLYSTTKLDIVHPPVFQELRLSKIEVELTVMRLSETERQ